MEAETSSNAILLSRVARGRIEWLDALRGMAAFAVLLSHVSRTLWGSVDRFFVFTMPFDFAAVIAFFAISGYIIPVSIERSSSLRVFWIRRFWRLYPAYWFALAMALGVIVLRPSVRGENAPGLSLLPLDLLMVRGAVGLTVLPVAWTLWVELLFYVLASVLCLAGLHRRPSTVAWGLIFLSFGLRRLAPGLDWLSGELPTWNLLLFLAIMAVGTCLYRLDRGELRPLFAYGALAGLLLYMVRHLIQSGGHSYAGAHLVGLGAFLVARQLRHVEIPRLFLWLGRISYSLYLVHPVVMAGLVPVGPRPLTLLVWVGVSLVVASLSYRFIEAPAERFGRYLTSSSRTRPAEVPTAPALAVEAG